MIKLIKMLLCIFSLAILFKMVRKDWLTQKLDFNDNIKELDIISDT